MYSPVLNVSIADKLISGADDMFQYLDSLVFDLEDAIREESAEEAERMLVANLRRINCAYGSGEYINKYSPLLFARVRSPEQLTRLAAETGDAINVLTGFVIPKFDTSNAEKYITACLSVNKCGRAPLRFMPILETPSLIYVERRSEELLAIREVLEGVRDYVLNIRVGGNDFCSIYGLRRNARQSIYDIGVIRDALMDILNVFARDFIVSAPVWDFFGGTGWREGLERELELDMLNGFIGKTAIHPSQLKIIRESLKVRRSDYDDALHIINWDDGRLGVAKSCDNSRMNELSVHGRWADKTITLAEIYGLRE